MCFHSATKNDLSNVVDSLQVVRSYSFMKKTKVCIRASFKTGNNIFIKEIKHVVIYQLSKSIFLVLLLDETTSRAREQVSLFPSNHALSGQHVMDR